MSAATATAARPGPISFGRYKLIRRIGAGGMGEVFLAREESGPQPRACVVKKILSNLSENRAFVGRFLDESKVVVRLKHPNIARVYAMGEVKGEYFLAMEYVQGKTISRFTKRLRERKREMPLGLIFLLGERICQGLGYAHDAQDENGAPIHLVHRDLSPANVCISYRGEVKIIDFGAAQSTLKEEQTAPRVVIGNLTYMAPEQAKKQHVDRRADVYSVGVMLWELLAGHALPQKGDPIERWRKAANPAWEPPSMFRGNLPPEVDLAILKALRKEPEDRYANAIQLGAELQRLRKKYAPNVADRDLAALLSEVFAKEKAAEDVVLEATIRGASFTDVPTGKSKRPMVVPPTALAFEHTAVEPPAAYRPELEEVTNTEGVGPRTRTQSGQGGGLDEPGPTRVGFGVTFTSEAHSVHSQSLLEEIEPGAADEDEPKTASVEGTGLLPTVLFYGAVFFGSAGVGLLGMWAWLGYRP